MKKLIISLAVAIAALVAAVAVVWNGEIRTLASIHQVGSDPYLYECEYSAPYDLDAVVENIEAGLYAIHSEIKTEAFCCEILPVAYTVNGE